MMSKSVRTVGPLFSCTLWAFVACQATIGAREPVGEDEPRTEVSEEKTQQEETEEEVPELVLDEEVVVEPEIVSPSDPFKANPPRGLYSNPVAVELQVPADYEHIYYTLNNTPPSPENGQIYTGPIPVVGDASNGVRILRAVAVDAMNSLSSVATYSYVFPELVLAQGQQPPGLPDTWGITKTRPSDYEMDPIILNDQNTRADAIQALRAIDTLSIVTEHAHLWGPSGIYMNPENEGVEWERPTSAELIKKDGTPGFQVYAGLRIQGGSSQKEWKSAKLSMRLLFKKLYGPGKLHYKFFDDSPVGVFNTLVLDAHLNQTPIHPSHDERIRSQYIIDQYVSKMQTTLGGVAPHHRNVHLFLNGIYWGVYDIHERPDASFAASYLGGKRMDYDVVRHRSDNIVEGDNVAWNTMFEIARSGLDNPAVYEDLQQYLALGPFIDYMLVNFYVGNTDWDYHNWYAARRRADGAGYHLFSWDAELSLRGLHDDRTKEIRNSAPTDLYHLLRKQPSFVQRFNDRARELFSPGGAFYVDPTAPNYDPANPGRNVPAHAYWTQSNAALPVLLLEVIRWGDNRRPGDAYDVEDWKTERRRLMEDYFPHRSAVVMNQLGLQ